MLNPPGESARRQSGPCANAPPVQPVHPPVFISQLLFYHSPAGPARNDRHELPDTGTVLLSCSDNTAEPHVFIILTLIDQYFPKKTWCSFFLHQRNA
jgi:hypothetical protein